MLVGQSTSSEYIQFEIWIIKLYWVKENITNWLWNILYSYKSIPMLKIEI